jgi:N-acetylglucosamine-6-phosphate deacetylase
MAALFDKRVAVEVIADMKHVEKSLLRLLAALKDSSSIILITDSVRAKSSGHKKGSALTMIDAVRNMVKYCGVSLVDAVNMASLNPAVAFGVSHDKGSIRPGKDADVVVFDKNFDVKMTMVRGKIAYSKKGFTCAA